MNLQGLLSKVLGFLVIIITLALAPAINTANTAVINDNLTNCIGMTAISDFGAPLIILGLLAMGGIFVWKASKGSSMQDMFKVIGAVVVAIVGLTFMTNIIEYTNTLIDASSGFATTIYGMIPLIVYLAIVASVGYGAYTSYKGGKGRRSSRAVANY
jgi:hypothetical protein